MAVSSPWRAHDTLRDLIYGEPRTIRTVLRDPYLPDGWTVRADQPRIVDDQVLVGAYGFDRRYEFERAIAPVVASSPAAVLGDPDRSAEDKKAFLTTSLDLTMQGGTTSGVVYPLAVCELATSFRFRNVGGASAGAIAAAITAAAELGRSRRSQDVLGEQAPGEQPLGEQVPGEQVPGEQPLDDQPTPPRPAGSPRVRQGFAGVADLMAWLTQVDAARPGADEFRLAQLFRPGPETHRIFRVAVAAMRGRSWPLPLLALFAIGPITRLVTVLLVLLTVVVTGWVGARFAGLIRPWWQTIGWGLLETTAFVVGLIGMINLCQGMVNLLRYRRQTRADQRGAGTPLGALRRHTSGAPITRARFRVSLISGAVLVGLAVVDGVFRPWQFLGACFVGLAGSFVLVVWLLVGLLRMISSFGRASYGLIGGTTPPRARNLLDRLAAVPPSTVGPSLVPWLSSCLSQLAGLPDGAVLRFGHLWHGTAYVPTLPDAANFGSAAREQDARAAVPPSDERLVNLELMTTDLTRRRPYRFPLTPSPDPSDELYLRMDQIGEAGLFPPDVLAVLGERQPITAPDQHGVERCYHPLPRPADLPVIFAVRLSMALPALFQAVPLHRFVTDTAIRDDLGRQVMIGDQPLTAFAVDRLTNPIGNGSEGRALPERRAEELWFSDGGITSNFPVHFFDAPLPRWPTVSLNLGNHPATNPIQDVSLPQDWDQNPTPVDPLRPSGLVLPSAILDTAMSWRDRMQSAMPGYRNRIAQVRSRRDEGGTNLFMTTETIASMGLRGVVAGARLKARFADAPQWDRFRWLRLRVALSNLDQLRVSTCSRRATYAEPLDGPRWLAELREEFGSVPSGLDVESVRAVEWYEPAESFWPSADHFLAEFGQANGGGDPNPLTTAPPLPEPRFRQAPQE